MKLIKKNKRAKDCGVVAAFNAASWCHLYRPYRDIEKVAMSCGYSRKKGIYLFQFAALLNRLEIPAKRIRPKSVESLESRIYIGRFIVVLYTPNGYDLGHVIVAFLDHRGNIRVINPDSERTTWGDLAADINANGMKEFHVYEVPNRRFLKEKNDESRAAKSCNKGLQPSLGK